MALTERLSIVIDAHSGGALREMNRVEHSVRKLGDEGKKAGGVFDRLGGQFGVSGSALKAGVAAGAAAAGVALIKFGADGVQAASNLEQSVGAVESVFGSASDKIFKFGETASNAAGLSKREVNEMAAVVGAQLQGMGFAAGKSADEVIKLERRAADMAATFGGSTRQALEAISATLRGERDPIERYGVSLKDADIQARILALGLDTSTVAAKKEAAAIASLDLLMAQTSKTQGQFSRESESLAGAQARLSASTENLKATVGEGLTPALAGLAEAANDAIGPLDALIKKGNEAGVTQKVLGASISPLLFAVGEFSDRVEGVGDALDGTSGKTKELATETRGAAAATTSAAEKLKLEEEAAKDAATALDKVKSAMIASFDARRSFASATDSVRLAEIQMAAKQADLNALLKAGAVDAKAVEQAHRDLSAATKTLASAQERSKNAQVALNKALAGPTDDELADTQLDLRDAKLGVADANDRVQEAQAELNQAMADGDLEAIDDATRGLESANIALERAQRAASAALKANNDLNPNSEAGTQRVRDAYTELALANEAVEDAQRGVWDSTVNLNTAQAGDLDFTQKVWAAKVDLLAAQRDVTSAQEDAASKAITLSDAMFQQAVVVGANAEAVGKLRENLGLLQAQYPHLAPILAAMYAGGTGTGTGTLLRPGIAGAPGYRASGGPVNAGGAYVVGENGPELLQMGGRGGYVHANGSGGGTINVYMPPGSDGDDVVAALARWQRRNGPVPITTR